MSGEDEKYIIYKRRNNFMIAVNEGNSECLRCKHFDLGLGCALIVVKNELPPCGRDVVLTQEE